jgi:hypothetical protein
MALASDLAMECPWATQVFIPWLLWMGLSRQIDGMVMGLDLAGEVSPKVPQFSP